MTTNSPTNQQSSTDELRPLVAAEIESLRAGLKTGAIKDAKDAWEVETVDNIMQLIIAHEAASVQAAMNKLPITTLYAAEWTDPEHTPTEFKNRDVVLAEDLPR